MNEIPFNFRAKNRHKNSKNMSTDDSCMVSLNQKMDPTSMRNHNKGMANVLKKRTNDLIKRRRLEINPEHVLFNVDQAA